MVTPLLLQVNISTIVSNLTGSGCQVRNTVADSTKWHRNWAFGDCESKKVPHI